MADASYVLAVGTSRHVLHLQNACLGSALLGFLLLLFWVAGEISHLQKPCLGAALLAFCFFFFGLQERSPFLSGEPSKTPEEPERQFWYSGSLTVTVWLDNASTLYCLSKCSSGDITSFCTWRADALPSHPPETHAVKCAFVTARRTCVSTYFEIAFHHILKACNFELLNV